LLFSLAILAATIVLFQRIPKGFLPVEDTDQLFAMTEAVEVCPSIPSRTAKEYRGRHQGKPERLGLHVERRVPGGIGGPNNGIVFMRLKPRRERTASAPEIIAQLMPKLSEIPDARVSAVPRRSGFGGTLTKSEYQLALQGTTRKSSIARRRCSRTSSRNRASSKRHDGSPTQEPELDVDVDRESARAAYGLFGRAGRGRALQRLLARPGFDDLRGANTYRDSRAIRRRRANRSALGRTVRAVGETEHSCASRSRRT